MGYIDFTSELPLLCLLIISKSTLKRFKYVLLSFEIRCFVGLAKFLDYEVKCTVWKKMIAFLNLTVRLCLIVRVLEKTGIFLEFCTISDFWK